MAALSVSSPMPFLRRSRRMKTCKRPHLFVFRNRPARQADDSRARAISTTQRVHRQIAEANRYAIANSEWMPPCGCCCQPLRLSGRHATPPSSFSVRRAPRTDVRSRTNYYCRLRGSAGKLRESMRDAHDSAGMTLEDDLPLTATCHTPRRPFNPSGNRCPLPVSKMMNVAVLGAAQKLVVHHDLGDAAIGSSGQNRRGRHPDCRV
jgi:hypothetical protein